uniref:Uncharacterized protein n=1 Tax=Dromaius novaehollandiae TaxID=8790 RepID=A0A8C4KHU8_DRONO
FASQSDFPDYLLQLSPGDGGAASVLVLGLHVEVGQLGPWPALPGEEVGAGTLEVKEEAVERVVVGISKHHAGAALHGHALEELDLRLTRFKGATSHLLAEDLVVEVQAAALGGAVCVVPEDLSLTKKLP